MLIPYRVDLELRRVPVITILVTVLCLAIYAVQDRGLQTAVDRSVHFCSARTGTMDRLVLEQSLGIRAPAACMELLFTLRYADDTDSLLDGLVQDSLRISGYSAQQSRTVVRRYLDRMLSEYRLAVPRSTTENLWYEPHSWNPVRMISSAFAHGSWSHVIGNLFFWFAFAATVEVIVGPVAFIGLILGIALGSSVLYSLAMLGVRQPPATLGLSGVVSGMMALLLYFLPRARIRFFFFLLFFFKRFAVPVWLVVAWFIGWDAYALFLGGGREGINLIAHVGGAALGLLCGFLFFRARRAEVQEMTRGAF